MNSNDRRRLGMLALLVGSSPGCGPDHDRQTVIIIPRQAEIRPEGKSAGRARASVPGTLPPGRGVDVPEIGPQ